MSYGLEVYNEDEVQLVGVNSDLCSLAASDVITIPASGSQVISIPGLRNTDQWSVFLFNANSSTVFTNTYYTINTDELVLTNGSSQSADTIRYLVIRSG
jgi:hypothetical protein